MLKSRTYMIPGGHLAVREIHTFSMVRPSKAVVPRIVPLLVGVAAVRARPDLELRAVVVHAVRDVEALRIAEDLDLSIREGPFLRICACARLEVDERAIGV